MSDLARLRIWDDQVIRGALWWYLDVAENRRQAKFRSAATVATQLDPGQAARTPSGSNLDRLADLLVKHIDYKAFLHKTPVLTSSLLTSRSEYWRPPRYRAA